MRRVLSAALMAALLLAGGALVRAHHSFPAEFDINRPIQLTGTVTKVEWIYPHA